MIMRYPFKPFVKSLGVFLGSSLTMSKQVSNLCCTAYLEICRLGIIDHFWLKRQPRSLSALGFWTDLTTVIPFLLALPQSKCRAFSVSKTVQQNLSSKRKADIMLHLFLKNTLASNQMKNRFQNCNISLQALQQHFTLVPVSQAYCLHTF